MSVFKQLLFMSVLICAVQVSAAEKNTIKSRWVSAISNDNASLLSELLQRSDHHALWALTASNGKTALMVACKVGDEVLAKQLVAKGADIRAKTLTNGTAFMFAILGDELDLAAWLKTLGADINARGSNGWSSVMIAAAKGLDSTLLWLLQQGANAGTPDVYGFTPLMRAADNNHKGAVEILLASSDANINWEDELANTALHYAVSGANADIVEQLITAGADDSVVNEAGLSPVELAKQFVEADELGSAKSANPNNSTDPQVAMRVTILELFTKAEKTP